MNTTEWLQEQVEEFECNIQVLSESINSLEGQISTWTKLKDARQQELDDTIEIKRHLSLLVEQMLLAENL